MNKKSCGHREIGSRRSNRRSGSIVVIVALSLTVLLGFCALAVDYGQLVWRKNQLQRACDASALAGASQLPDKRKAQDVAGTVAGQNGVTNPTYDFRGGTSQIQVSATQRVQFGFARVLGINSSLVGASAIAERAALTAVPGAVPLTMTPEDYAAHKNGKSFELLLINNSVQAFTNNTMAALDLRPDNSGKSGAVFQRDLTDGYFDKIYFNQQINNGLEASLNSVGAKFTDAMNQRFADAAAAPYADNGTNYTFPDYPSNDRRIIPLIVANANPAGSAPLLTARSLVPVYVESIRSVLGLDLYYMRMRILPSQLYSADDSNVVVGDGSNPDTGFASVRLIG